MKDLNIIIMICNFIVTAANILYSIYRIEKADRIEDIVCDLRLNKGSTDINLVFLRYAIGIINNKIHYKGSYRFMGMSELSILYLLSDKLCEIHFNSYKKLLTLKWIQSCIASGMKYPN